MVQHYELLFIVSGTKTDEEAPGIAQQVLDLVQQRGAANIKSEAWGKRKLAYEIQKIRQGFYTVVEFDLESTKLQDLENALRLGGLVLRHQIIRKEVLSPERLAEAEALRQHIASKRQAAKEKEAATSIAAGHAPEPKAPETTGPVSTEKLDEKLEEILESEQVEV